jgi:hypothetical protein
MGRQQGGILSHLPLTVRVKAAPRSSLRPQCQCKERLGVGRGSDGIQDVHF